MLNTVAKSGLMTIAAISFVAGSAMAQATGENLPLYPRDAADVCDAGATQVRVTVTGASQQGIAKVELYKPEDNWLKDETRKVRVAAQDGPFQVCMNVEPGTYAIVGYHDKNANRKLDKKFPFKPKEPFGVVNQEKLTKKKRPKFKQVSFQVGQGGVDVTLNLVDPKDN